MRFPLSTAFPATFLIWSGIVAASIFLPSNASAEDRLQASVSEMTKDTGGAAIVSDPRTGRILALWNRRVIFERRFPPGSTAKLVTSAVALENRLITPEEKLYCRRVPRLLGEVYRCSHAEALEPYTLTTAIANSCNYFFCELSTRIDAATLTRGFVQLGLGGGFEGNARLRIPAEPRAKARAALGDMPVTVTPAELLLAYSAVATRGTIHELHQNSKNPARGERIVRLNPSTWQALAGGFEECVRSGTCQGAAVPGVRVAGKTGTAGAADGSGWTHAWFAGYAPAEAPQVAIVVLLHRGTGTLDAAPLAGRILRQYFAGNVTP